MQVRPRWPSAGCGPARKGAATGGGNPLFCSTESLPVAFIISFVDVYSDLEPGLPAIPVTAVLVVRWLFYQRASLLCRCCTPRCAAGLPAHAQRKGINFPNRPRLVPRLELHPLPLLHKWLTATATGAFLAGAGARALAQQRMAGLAKRLGLGWAGSLAGGEQTSAQANALGVCPAGFASCADHMWLCFTACLSPSCLFSP